VSVVSTVEMNGSVKQYTFSVHTMCMIEVPFRAVIVSPVYGKVHRDIYSDLSSSVSHAICRT
jgi:hypothetical protein